MQKFTTSNMGGISWTVHPSLSAQEVAHHIRVPMLSFDVAVHPKFSLLLFIFQKYSFH